MEETSRNALDWVCPVWPVSSGHQHCTQETITFLHVSGREEACIKWQDALFCFVCYLIRAFAKERSSPDLGERE